MISVPVAVYNDKFKWELDLFWYNHKLVYNDLANSKTIAVVIERNLPTEKFHSFNWSLSIPFKICKPCFEYLDLSTFNPVYVPLNIQVGLAQIIDNIDDNELVEVLDCDMFHLKQKEYMVGDNEILVDTIYENWHLRSLTDNKPVISKYLKTDGFYNGGFVPIICKAKVLKKILPDWIDAHLKILKDPHSNNIHWWAGMFALQIACANNAIQMISKDMCYIPGANELNDNHHIAHYSVDEIFNKHKFPQVNWLDFKDNVFYNRIKSWYFNSYLTSGK